MQNIFIPTLELDVYTVCIQPISVSDNRWQQDYAALLCTSITLVGHHCVYEIYIIISPKIWIKLTTHFHFVHM